MSTQPDYVSFEPKAREELLSQIGSFSPAERQLFQRLCESWAPVIGWTRFFSQAGGAEQEITALERLTAKLRSAELGLVRTEVLEDKRVPAGIVLTGKGDLSFFMHLIEEETARLTESGYRILPSVPRLEQRKVVPPDYHVTDADSIVIAEAYLAEDPEPAIYRVRLLGDYRILVTSNAVRPLIRNSVTWLRTNLEERGFLDEVARVKDLGLMELKQRLADKTPDVWLDITRSIVQERSTIAFRKNIEETDEIFQTAFLIMNFADAQIGAAKAQKETDTRVDDELRAIAEMVERAPDGRMSQADFSNTVELSGQKLGRAAVQLTGAIERRMMTPRPHRRLPVVVCVDGTYIHHNRVKQVFETARQQLAERLREEYTEILDSFLRGRAPEVGEVFASKGDLNDDILARVQRADPVLAGLISRPQMLAEAVIRDAKLRQENVSTEELKNILGQYFDVESSRLLPAAVLFDVDLVEILDTAFGRINVFRQIFLRFSGRYESLKRSYSRRFGGQRKRISYLDEAGPVAPRGGRTRTEQQDAPGVRVHGTGPRDHRPETVEVQRRPRPAPRPKVRSPREVDRAWKDFDEALHTKIHDRSEEDSS